METLTVWTLPETSDRGPALAVAHGWTFLAWKGVGNNRVNVGVINGGIVRKFPSHQRTSHQPALVGGNSVYVAWKGDGNDNLNGAEVIWDTDSAGVTAVKGFKDPDVLSETSRAGPALGGDMINMFLAWRGSGNEQLNVADVRASVGSSSGSPPAPEWDVATETLPDSSDTRPAVTMNEGVTFMAFKGADNTSLNILASPPTGPPDRLPITDPTAKVVLPENSSHAPALAVHRDEVWIAWKGADNSLLNVARVGARMGAPESPSALVTGLEQKRTFTNAQTDEAPALVSTESRLLLAWKGNGNNWLNIAPVLI